MNTLPRSRNADASVDPLTIPLGRIFDAALEAIVLIDEAQCIVALNPAALTMFGISAPQALGRTLARFIPGCFVGGAAAQQDGFTSEVGPEGGVTQRRCAVARRADGTDLPVEVRLSRIDLAPDPRPRRYVAALIRDRSAEHALRDELEGLQRHLWAVFDLAPVALWIADADRIAFANSAALALLGSDAVCGRSLYSVLRPDSHAAVRRQVERALAGDTGITVVPAALLRGDGESREVEIAVAALPDHGHTTVQMVVADITRQRADATQREQSRQLLRRLSENVVEAREAERRRIARELHDELGQRLTALKMDLETYSATHAADADAPRLSAMVALIDDTVASVRRIAADLRPMMLDDLGLSAAIEWLAAEAMSRLGIEVVVSLDELTAPVGDRVAIALYRMVQEALTNVSRHASASRVEIALFQAGAELLLVVRDDGAGFPEHALQREGSYGLLGMRERADMLGGRVEIDNPPGGGGRVTVRLPFEPAAAPPSAAGTQEV